jgi:uncharacterized protein (TIGR02453 family)
MAAPAARFTGFRKEAIEFLADLAVNNNRTWFQLRKDLYEMLLKDPLEAFVAALAVSLEARKVPLRADPARSPFRIYRDIRFAKDKSPYKTNIGASFPWIEGTPAGGTSDAEAEGPHGVGGYFHFSPGEIYVGGGMWHPEKPRLDAFRRLVADNPKSVHAVFEDPWFKRQFGAVSGEKLQRMPQGYPADHPDAALLMLKDVTFGRRLSDKEVFSPKLPDMVAERFASAVPVFRLLARLG